MLLVLAAVVATAMGALAPGERVGAAVPTPANDPFYQPPAGYSAAANGTVLRERAITPLALGAPMPARGWQLLYKSVDESGNPTAEVATVLVPLVPWLGSGPRPLVSYQTAEDSVGSQCAPSYALRSGLPTITSNAELETSLMLLLLARGWAVVTSDYEGPGSHFLSGPQAAHGVLDGARAALHFPADGLSAQTPLGLWGYSGGGFATAWATQLQHAYAPDLHPTGIAMGGTPADLLTSMMNVDGGYGFGLVMGGMVGLSRGYPAKHLRGLFTPLGQAALDSSADDCTVTLVATYAFHALSEYTFSSTPYQTSTLRSVLTANSPHAVRTSAALYDYHAVEDELVPVAVDDAFVAHYCSAGDHVQVVRDSPNTHNTEMMSGAPGAIDFLAARFAGQPTPDNCP
jgi:hypothetical protein